MWPVEVGSVLICTCIHGSSLCGFLTMLPSFIPVLRMTMPGILLNVSILKTHIVRYQEKH